MTTPEWTVVVPVKGTAAAKSRLGATVPLARAIALDTVEAAIGSRAVARVIVVTAIGEASEFERLGATIVADLGTGLGAAVRSGLAAAGDSRVAVLLGDLPALVPDELDAALASAAAHPLAFVPDADGIGSSLVTALSALDHRPAFGADSARAHLAAGYVELAMPADSGLRRDVDTRAQLDGLASAGRLGRRTAELARGADSRTGASAEVDSLKQ